MSDGFVMQKCNMCPNTYRFTIAIFPYKGDLNETCIACLGKHKIDTSGYEPKLGVPRGATRAKKHEFYKETPPASIEDAIAYLTAKGE